jgi:hypothetical protein
MAKRGPIVATRYMSIRRMTAVWSGWLMASSPLQEAGGLIFSNLNVEKDII